MKNPWEKIKLDDYENHMKLDSVYQLQALNEMMEKQFNKYYVESVMILGVAGGNGLEHINTDKFKKVYGIDINKDYLSECQKRFNNLNTVLTLLCIDLTNDISVLPNADLLIANLLIEYIGYEHFKKVIKKVKAEFVSCIVQINTDDTFVSNSPYLHIFNDLKKVHCQIDEKSLKNVMKEINYKHCFQSEKLLPNGKKLLRIDFKKSV